jgi:hypothetical protein
MPISYIKERSGFRHHRVDGERMSSTPLARGIWKSGRMLLIPILISGAWASPASAIPPPQGAGALLVYEPSDSRLLCGPSPLTRYPPRTVQYWLTFAGFWRLEVQGRSIRLTKLAYPFSDSALGEAMRRADAESLSPGGCRLRGEFGTNIGDPDSINALFPDVSIGRMRKYKEAWYWAEK